ncbi:hypothetical protein ABZ619_13685 [Streptomyces sp. NPDC007851]
MNHGARSLLRLLRGSQMAGTAGRGPVDLLGPAGELLLPASRSSR